MRQITIAPNEAGQRLDKFLHKYLKDAPASFFYKMMRKKNITLNGAKCTGSEKVKEGDEIRFFLAEETLEKFGAPAEKSCDTVEYERAFSAFGSLPVVYEDAHILAVSKPAGILSQKTRPDELSLNEWLIGYLLCTGAVCEAELCTFKPSVCNRLDRNTSGLVLCGKSLEGTQLLTETIRRRSVRKFYRLMVKGILTEEGVYDAWLKKDAKTNQVRIYEQKEEGAEQIRTGIHPLSSGVLPGNIPFTYAEAELFTGKTHQIRAHLSSIGHPILGDYKYGDERTNGACKRLGVKSQLLHAYRVEFPDALPAHFAALQGRTLTASLPQSFAPLTARLSGQGENDGNLEFERSARLHAGGPDQPHK